MQHKLHAIVDDDYNDGIFRQMTYFGPSALTSARLIDTGKRSIRTTVRLGLKSFFIFVICCCYVVDIKILFEIGLCSDVFSYT